MQIPSGFRSAGRIFVAAVSAYNVVATVLDVTTVEDVRAAVPKVVFWFVMFVAFFGWELVSAHLRIHALETAPKPSLRIVFFPDKRPYLQEIPNVPVPIGDDKHVLCTDRRFRVGIQASGPAQIENCRVVLEDCEPSDEFGFPDHELRLMDTDPPQGTFTIHSADKPTRFVDVVYDLSPPRGQVHSIGICYAREGLAHLLPSGVYRFTLRVEGGGAQDRRAFMVEKRPGGVLQMRPEEFRV